MNVVIIGGGFIGQLIHTLLPKARVLDWRPSPPDPTKQSRMYGPQYLWEPIDGLPCRKFDVVTHVDGRAAVDEAVLAYKRKVGKEQDAGDWRTQFRTHMDGWSVDLPPSRVEYNRRVARIARLEHRLVMADGEVLPYDYLITTIPMYSTLAMAGFPAAESAFKWRPIYMTVQPAFTAPGRMMVNYISSPSTAVYRETYRDNALHVEALEPLDEGKDGRALKMVPGKIYAHSGTVEGELVLRQYGIYPFGRYAAWHPDELAHETYRAARAFVARLS